MRVMPVVALLLFGMTLHADSPWRTSAGGFGFRWHTLGHHGHDQPMCDNAEVDACNASDFARANLDDSIGFRAGRERDLWTSGRLRLVGGVEASVSHTEYNLSQRDFSLLTGALFTGADVELAGIVLGARIGGGGYTTSMRDQSGLVRFREFAATLPLRSGAAVRVSRRIFTLSGMEAAPSRDVAISLVSTDTPGQESQWELSAATGITAPGFGLGGDRKLRSTALNRTAVLRTLGRPELQLELSWSSSAHESSEPSVFRGYDGNFRSKTIEGYGFALAHTTPLPARLSMRWSAGFELADWRDEHRLLTRNSEELVAGRELALAAGAALRWQLQPRLAIETAAQKLYWRGIDLSESRWTVGIVHTR